METSDTQDRDKDVCYRTTTVHILSPLMLSPMGMTSVNAPM